MLPANSAVLVASGMLACRYQAEYSILKVAQCSGSLPDGCFQANLVEDAIEALVGMEARRPYTGIKLWPSLASVSA